MNKKCVMRKLVPSEPNPYAIAMEKHLCEHDMADWLACAGHGDNFCAACNNEKEHSHNSQSTPRESPTPASEEGFADARKIIEHHLEKETKRIGGDTNAVTVALEKLRVNIILEAYIAERVKEAERQARLDEAKWWWENCSTPKAHLKRRIAYLEAKK